MTFNELIFFLQENDNFLLVSHANPDGDATGSELALLQILGQMGKKASILNADKALNKFTFFDNEKDIHSLEEGAPVPEDLSQKNLILLDTADFYHTGKAQEVLLPFAKRIVIIDHHSPKPNPKAEVYVDETASATCQIIYEIHEALQVALNHRAAVAIFVGIVYDTGSFIYHKTLPRTFEIAKNLTQTGVKPKEIHSNLYETIEPTRMKLLAKVQSTMKLKSKNTIAVQTLRQKMLKETKAEMGESENFINYPLKCFTVLVSVLFKEQAHGGFRCSLRSKGSIDISSIAMLFGGGGHRNAAGFTCPSEPLRQFAPKLLKLINKLMKKGQI